MDVLVRHPVAERVQDAAREGDRRLQGYGEGDVGREADVRDVGIGEGASSRRALSLTQSTILDLPLPLKQVRVHVQDPNGNPVAGVNLTTNLSFYPNLPIGILTAGYGYSAYPYYLPPATTSSSGDATLWLFPDGPNDDYTITARGDLEGVIAGGVGDLLDRAVGSGRLLPRPLQLYL